MSAGLVGLAATPCLASAQSYLLVQPAPSAQLPDPALPSDGPTTDLPVSADDHARAVECMSMAIAYEAAGQPVAGQQAVGQVILNRLRAARFPKTVCGVVFQGSERLTGCQFTFTCDGSFRRRLSDATLYIARSTAELVMRGEAPDRVAGATHYHADYVLPYWAASGTAVARIGAHIFYRMPGDVSRGAAAASLTLAEPAVPQAGRFGRLETDRPTWPHARPMLAQATAPHAIFAPWGLPVGGVVQR